jgi:uncharacterized membrane protein YfcA
LNNEHRFVSADADALNRSPAGAVAGGASVGVLGGLIGLGGAEFRLPLLIGLYRFPPLEAIIVNKAMSLAVVTAALVFRSRAVPLEQLVAHTSVIVNLLAGSLIGAWLGAGLATRLHSRTLYRLISLLLVGVAVVLLLGHEAATAQHAGLEGGPALWAAGIVAGFLIGVVASILGVAGGELLIPTLILLFGIDIKLAGSLSLAVSLPTMLVGFARYSQDRSFIALRNNGRFVFWMTVGSIAGALAGGVLLGRIDPSWLYPMLASILLISSIKVWRHG